MASGSITSWQIDGETMKTGRDFIFLGSKITVDSDCSHEIKRSVLLGRKAMTNGLQHIRLLHPWDFPGNSTGVGCHFLLQGIFPTQGLNTGLPHCRQTLYTQVLISRPREHIMIKAFPGSIFLFFSFSKKLSV